MEIGPLGDQHMRTDIVDDVTQRLHGFGCLAERLVWKSEDAHIRHSEESADVTKFPLLEFSVCFSSLVDNAGILVFLGFKQFVMQPLIVGAYAIGHADGCDRVAPGRVDAAGTGAVREVVWVCHDDEDAQRLLRALLRQSESPLFWIGYLVFRR